MKRTLLIASLAASLALNGALVFLYFKWGSHTPVLYLHTKSEGRSQDIIMLGDSLTAWNHWGEFFPDASVKNFGKGGDRVKGALERFRLGVKESPKKVFVMIGVNDLFGGRSAAEVALDTKELLRFIKKKFPEVPVIFQSVLPLNHSLYGGRLQNDEVRRLNGFIRPEVETLGYSYLDLHALMAGPDGELKSVLTTDGIHLNAEGYALWINTIKPHIEGEKK